MTQNPKGCRWFLAADFHRLLQGFTRDLSSGDAVVSEMAASVFSMSVRGARLVDVPEGDTIHRTAGRLKPVLEGKTVRAFSAARLVEAGPSSGTVIESVEAVGKYLLVRFGDGTTLETHMKMSGSWHIYKAGERWRRARSSARATIETDDGWIAVCFSAPHVKIIRTEQRRGGIAARRSPAAASTDHLGPDLCLPDPDISEAVRRFSLRSGDTPAAVALLDQRICCGVGNVYKSEVLFACGIHPATPIGLLDQQTREALVDVSATMLKQNLGSGPRVTVVVDGRPGLAVYGRSGLPCIRCRTPISSGTHGIHARSSYWCPSCQPQSPPEALLANGFGGSPPWLK